MRRFTRHPVQDPQGRMMCRKGVPGGGQACTIKRLPEGVFFPVSSYIVVCLVQLVRILISYRLRITGERGEQIAKSVES